MANKNSTLVSNLFAKPQVANDVQELHGRKRVALGTIALEAADLSATDTVMLCPIPSNAVITSIQIANDDLDTGATNTFDLGVYTANNAGDTFTAVDDDCYVTASTQLRAAATFTELRWETLNINTLGQKVWEDAGATEDPGDQYFIGMLFDAAGDQAGDISFIIEYVVD